MPNDRFSPQTAEVLRAVGWSPGRDIGDLAERMLERTIESARAEGYEIEPFPAVRAAMHEFGGLDVTREGSGVSYIGDDFRIDSSLVVANFGKFDHIAHIVRQPVFPLGGEFREHSSFLMAENGEVYFLHRNGTYYAGSDIEETLQSLIETSGPMTDLWEYYEMDVVEESGWRFNDRVTPVLLGAGWALGRDLGAEADEMTARTVAGARELGYELEPFPAAVAAIHEFGGLTFTKDALAETTEFNGTDLRIDPSAALEWVVRTGPVLERTVGKRCFPLGRDLEFGFVLWMDSDGAVYEVYENGSKIHAVGEDVDKALSNWLQVYPFEEISVPTDKPED